MKEEVDKLVAELDELEKKAKPPFRNGWMIEQGNFDIALRRAWPKLREALLQQHSGNSTSTVDAQQPQVPGAVARKLLSIFGEYAQFSRLGPTERAELDTLVYEADVRIDSLLDALRETTDALQNIGDYWAYALGKADGAELTAEDHAAAHQVGNSAGITRDKARALLARIGSPQPATRESGGTVEAE